jgi:hypothetical protein
MALVTTTSDAVGTLCRLFDHDLIRLVVNVKLGRGAWSCVVMGNGFPRVSES